MSEFKVGDKVELQNCGHSEHCGMSYLDEMTIIEIDTCKYNKFPYKCSAGKKICEFSSDELELIK